MNQDQFLGKIGILLVAGFGMVFGQGGGKALYFPGYGHVDIPHSSSIAPTTQITYEAWAISSDGGGYYPILDKRWEESTEPWSSYQMGFYYSNMLPGAMISNGEWGGYRGAGSPNAIVHGVWYHYATTYDGATLKFYINGILEGSTSTDITLNYSDLSLRIGASAPGDGQYFTGIIDEVRIWRTALSQTTLREWMYKPLDSSHPNFSDLGGYWPFNEGSGDTTLDVSGNGNTGNITGSLEWVTSTAPISVGCVYVTTTSEAIIGPLGGQARITITSTPDDNNSLIAYQTGSLEKSPTTDETYPEGIDKRSSIVWGISEYGDVTANVVFHYGNVPGVMNPATIKLLRRDYPGSATWSEVTLTDRNDVAKTLTVNGVTAFGEFTLGAGADNSLQPPIPTDHLIAYYPFNGNAYDESGNSHDATVYNATLTADRFDQANSAFYFDGDGDYLDLGDWTMGGEMSICVWVKYSTFNNYARIFSFANGAPGSGSWYYNCISLYNTDYDPHAYFGIWKGEADAVSATVNQNNFFSNTSWTFATIVMQDSTMKLYQNGILVATNSEGFEPDSVLRTEQYLGRQNMSWDQWFHGMIDDFRIYSRALTDSEITELYHESDHLVRIKPENRKVTEEFHLGNVYPNPFNAAFTIPLTLGKSSPVKLKLCDLNGKVVKVIENGIRPAGEYRLSVDCTDLSSGIYFLMTTIMNQNSAKKIVLIK